MLSTFMYLVLIYMLSFFTVLRTTYAQGKFSFVVKCRSLAVYKCGSHVQPLDSYTQTVKLSSIQFCLMIQRALFAKKGHIMFEPFQKWC